MRRSLHRLALAVIAGAALISAPIRATQTAAPAGSSSGALVDLRDVGELRARFNADQGQPRLVLLLSPT
jgi:hypothetical protein